MSDETHLKPCYKCKHKFDAKALECPACEYCDLERTIDLDFWETRKGRRLVGFIKNTVYSIGILISLLIIYLVGDY